MVSIVSYMISSTAGQLECSYTSQWITIVYFAPWDSVETVKVLKHVTRNRGEVASRKDVDT